MKTSITFSNGKTLNIGDTFYFFHPENHDGIVQECVVDSFWPEEPFYGDRIRFTTKQKSMWLFAYKQFFEREKPTCFLNYEDAKTAAENDKYSYM